VFLGVPLAQLVGVRAHFVATTLVQLEQLGRVIGLLLAA
jgi:hypothetical protein